MDEEKISRNSIRKKATASVRWSTVQNWGNQFIVLVVFFFLARYLSPQEFGLIALSEVFTNFIQIFLNTGVANALVQRKTITEEHINTAFWLNLFIGVFLTIILVIFAGLIGKIFDQPKLPLVIRCLSVSIIIGTLKGVHQALLTRNLLFKKLAISTTVAWIAGGIAGIFLAIKGFGIWSIIFLQIIKNTVETAILWSLGGYRPKLMISKKHAKAIFSFGANFMGLNFVIFFNKRIIDLLIGYFLGTTILGYYNIAFRIFNMVNQLVINTVNTILLPLFARIQSHKSLVNELYYKVIQLSSIIAYPIFLILATLAPQIIRLFGEQWNNSVPVLQIVAFAGPIYTITFINSSLIISLGKPNWRLLFGIITAVCNIAGLLLVIKLGVIYIALSFVLIKYLVAPISFNMVHRLNPLNLRQFILNSAPAVLGSIAIFLTMISVKYFLTNSLSSLTLLAISILLCVLSYTLSMRLLFPNTLKKTLSVVRDIMPNFIFRRA